MHTPADMPSAADQYCFAADASGLYLASCTAAVACGKLWSRSFHLSSAPCAWQPDVASAGSGCLFPRLRAVITQKLSVAEESGG